MERSIANWELYKTELFSIDFENMTCYLDLSFRTIKTKMSSNQSVLASR